MYMPAGETADHFIKLHSTVLLCTDGIDACLSMRGLEPDSTTDTFLASITVCHASLSGLNQRPLYTSSAYLHHSRTQSRQQFHSHAAANPLPTRVISGAAISAGCCMKTDTLG